MTGFIAAGFFARTIRFALAIPLAARRMWETPFLADLVIAAVRVDLAVRAVLVAAGFRLATVRVRDAALFTDFVAALGRAGFARRIVFLGIAFPLTECAREATLFTVFFAAAARAGFARRTVFLGIAFPLTAECAREATLLTVFFAAVDRAGFARRTVFFGIAFPLTAFRVREVPVFRAGDVADFVSITTYQLGCRSTEVGNFRLTVSKSERRMQNTLSIDPPIRLFVDPKLRSNERSRRAENGDQVS